ncbi:MAG: ATP-binding cassette domain-containing protein [bacterium]|nr:ATP-binding cassette domain-containing protein [bacterium]
MEELKVDLSNIYKQYVFRDGSLRPTFWRNLFKRSTEDLWALRAINLKVKKGESIGIIGANGAGKSTLLKIIAGITTQTKGEVEVKGKVAALINHRAGFNPELSGRENIFLNGLLLGMRRSEIQDRLGEIVSLSGLENFINSPLYTYSEGMASRLGVSVALHSSADILLADDVTDVADEVFRKKMDKRLAELKKERGLTEIFVSHGLPKRFKACTRVIWMDKGKVKEEGLPLRVIDSYQRYSQKRQK